MMTDFSDLILDEILLQYSSVSDRLGQVAALPPDADDFSPAQLQYLQSLDQRLDLLESRMLGYFPGETPARFQRTFPRWTSLWVSPETRTQRVGIWGAFRWRITLLPGRGPAPRGGGAPARLVRDGCLQRPVFLPAGDRRTAPAGCPETSRVLTAWPPGGRCNCPAHPVQCCLMTEPPRKTIVLAITGASGTPYGLDLLRKLHDSPRRGEPLS